MAGFAFGAAALAMISIADRRDAAERIQRRIEAQASYALGRADERQEGESDATGTNERGNATAAPAK